MVDDSADDRLLIEAAAARINKSYDWRLLDKGEDAVAYVTGKGAFADRSAHPLPVLMLIDLKMPRVSGFDVLSTLLKAQIPKPPHICVLTASNIQNDIDRAIALGADVFQTKPLDTKELSAFLQRLTDFVCLRYTNN